MYDAEIARFLGVDPLAQEFASWSGYNYVLGNPISLIDPDGRSPDNTIYMDTDGNEIHRTEDNLPDAVVIVDDVDAFNSCKSSCSSSESDRRSQGQVYLVEGLSLLWDSGSANVYGEDGAPVRGYQQEGGWTAEETARLQYNTDRDVVVNMSGAMDSGDPNGNMHGGVISANQGLAHTHPPNEGLRQVTGPNSTSPVRGHTDGGPPSDLDYKQIGNKSLQNGLRNVAVSTNNFHFYNKTSTFAVDRSFFKD